MGINAYYEDELAYLRDLGGEFALANPKLANFLGRDASDPDVERLLEGFAFLTARLRQRLDDELPELSHALIRLIWPHYLRPIPPLTILRFEASPTGNSAPVRIPAGARVRSRLVDGASCGFATSYGLDALPISLGEIEFESRPTSARLLFRLRASGKASLSALGSGKLRLFLSTERDPQVGRTLLLWLARHVRQIDCTSDQGTRLTLSQTAVRPGGLSDDEAILPWPMNTFSGFRLLQEYLTYPAKFLFVEIDGFAPLAMEGGKSATVSIEFDRPFPAQFRLGDGQIRLNCVPAINLFDHDADPIRVDRGKSEYRVLPLGGGALSIHSVDEVTGYQQGRSERRTYDRFESFRHDLPGDKSDRLYFRERLRGSVTGRGADTYVSFVDRLSEPASLEAEVVSLKLRCSNGVLADRLAVGSIDQPTTDLPSGVTVSNIASVSPEIQAPIGDNLMWRLVANLARNYASFTDIESLRSIVAVYDFRAVHDVQARRRLALLLESLDSFSTSSRDTVLRGIPARLRLLVLSVNESKLGGEAELFLFGSVLNAFFASYVGINSLHQFAVQGLESKAVFEWPPRFGQRPGELMADLLSDPDVGFFQFIEDFQRRNPSATPVGSTASPQREALLFRANPTFAFPAGEVAAVSPHPARENAVEVKLNLIGLYGPASPLPTIYTERVLDQEAGRSIADFLDLFNHRFAGLLFLIWKHYRHDLRYQPGASDALSLAFGSLFGLVPRRDPALDRERVTLLPYAGLLSMGSRSAESASRILGHFLGLPCRIEEFIPRRIDLPVSAQFMLGAPLEFGVETLLGESMEDVSGHCRVWIGPMPFARYLGLLPDGADHAKVQHAIDFVVNEPLSRDLGLVLDPGETPDWALGTGKLGWTTWTDPPRDIAVETVL